MKWAIVKWFWLCSDTYALVEPPLILWTCFRSWKYSFPSWFVFYFLWAIIGTLGEGSWHKWTIADNLRRWITLVVPFVYILSSPELHIGKQFMRLRVNYMLNLPLQTWFQVYHSIFWALLLVSRTSLESCTSGDTSAFSVNRLDKLLQNWSLIYFGQ